MIKEIFKRSEFFLLLIILVLSVILSSLSKAFFSFENLFDLIKNSSGMAILALGFFVVLLSGGIDLSFSAISIFCAYIATIVLVENQIDNLLLAFLISCLTGIFLGAINGLLVSFFKIPTLITTIGTFSIFNGVLLIIADGRSFYASEIPDWYNRFGQMTIFTITKGAGNTYGVSIYVLILIFIVFVTWFILRFTLLGKGIYAIGGDKESARRSGFNVMKIQFFVYCYMGFLAGVVAIMKAARLRSVVTSGISALDIMVIAAVALGGARITGGYGTIVGTLLGVALITILENNLVLIGLSSFWTKLVIGIVIIIGVSVTSLQIKLKERREIYL